MKKQIPLLQKKLSRGTIGFFDPPGFGLVFSNMEASKIQQQQS